MLIRSVSSMLLCVCLLAGYALAESSVAVDSLKGMIEVRRAGQEKWMGLTKPAKLYNNDLLRLGDSSTARLKWSDGNVAYVRANSQMLINNFENTEAKSLTQHFTVFYGAAFFLIKKVLPEQFFGREDTKVYTPTMLIAIRGTSFDVDVQPKTGLSRVRVLSGTVLVRNILRNVSTFVRSGLQSTVAINDDPVTPTAFLDKDIEGLRAWVPSQTITEEMAVQIAKGREEKLAATVVAAGKTKLVVMPFTNASTYKGAWQIGQGLGSMATAQISQTTKELSTALKGPAEMDPLKLGAQEGARFVLRGTVEDFDIIQRAKITARADEYIEYNTATVRLRLQLVDIPNNKLVFDNVFTGEVSDKYIPANSWQTISKLPFDLQNAQFKQSIVGKAVQQALEQGGQDLGRYLRDGF
jgi:TolB-like protein